MASARNQFSRPERFAEELTQLVSAGVVKVAGFDPRRSPEKKEFLAELRTRSITYRGLIPVCRL